MMTINNSSMVVSDKSQHRTESFDILKFILAFLVVVIHTGFSGYIGGSILAFARVAVPLFFMITGYYIPTMNTNKFGKHLKKILFLTITSTLFYLLISYIKSFCGTEVSTDWVAEKFNFKSICIWILFNESPYSGHLWYFYALLYVFLILYIFRRLKNIDCLYKILPILFLCNYLLSFASIFYYRNFLFTGLPYVLLGCLLRKHEEHLLNLFPKSSFLTIVFILFTLGLGFELLIYNWLGLSTYRDHYLFTLPMVVCIFLLVLQHPHYGAGSYIALIGRKYSAYIYILHPFFISLIKYPLKKFVGEWIFQSNLFINLFPFLVFGTTTIGIMIGYNIWKKLFYSKAS